MMYRYVEFIWFPKWLILRMLRLGDRELCPRLRADWSHDPVHAKFIPPSIYKRLCPSIGLSVGHARVKNHNQLPIGRIELRIGLIQQGIGLIELRIGLRMNNVRRGAPSWPVYPGLALCIQLISFPPWPDVPNVPTHVCSNNKLYWVYDTFSKIPTNHSSRGPWIK